MAEYVSLDAVIQAPGHAGQDRDSGFAHGGWTGRFMADHRRYNSPLSPAANGRQPGTSGPRPQAPASSYTGAGVWHSHGGKDRARHDLDRLLAGWALSGAQGVPGPER